MERVLNSFITLSTLLKEYEITYNSPKKIAEDLFIYFRKLRACLLAEAKVAEMIGALAESKFLLMIIVEVEI